MAGILDSKERVMDFIITQEGKRQAGQGELKVKFASFTDLHTFYETSGSAEIPTLASDASSRIYFEAYSRYQDVVVPELEAGYSLRPFRTSDFDIVGKSIASGTFQVGFIDRANVITGSELPELLSDVLTGVEKNFTDQKIIGSIDEYSFSQDFEPQPKQISFQIGDSTQYLRTTQERSDAVVNIDNVPSIFNDRRFSRFPNFMYLPPENLPLPGQDVGTKLANYPMLDEKPIQTIEEVMSSLSGKQSQTITFDPTSRFNNLVCQIFESSKLGVDKLSVIDFGNFSDENPGSPDSLQSPGRRVFFVGKIRRDSTGAETFVCIFTIVID
jgi:hypothetical protein